jgi:stage V sporulation protein G
MKITEVRITKLENSKLKGIGSVTLDSCFVVSGIKVMDGNNGLFVGMPSAKVKEEFKDICYPITKEFREELQKAVLAKYNDGAKEGSKAAEKCPDCGETNCSCELPF